MKIELYINGWPAELGDYAQQMAVLRAVEEKTSNVKRITDSGLLRILHHTYRHVQKRGDNILTVSRLPEAALGGRKSGKAEIIKKLVALFFPSVILLFMLTALRQCPENETMAVKDDTINAPYAVPVGAGADPTTRI